jgi:uncharacterized membrane protein
VAADTKGKSMEQTKGILDFLGTPLEVYSVTGTVLENSARDVTEISSERNLYGNITNIKSHNETLQDFWIRTESGKEIPISIGGAPLPARPGHRVEIFVASAKNRETRSIIGIKNHTSGRHVITANRYQKLPVNPGFFKFSLLHTLGAGVVTFIAMFTAIFFGFVLSVADVGSFGVLSVFIGILVISAFLWQHLYCNGRAAEFQTELSRLVEKGLS